jgi:L-amino acid N-acyltransferase YncA
MLIRDAAGRDFDAIWPIFRAVVSAGETYPYPRETSFDEARRLWLDQPRQTLVAESGDRIVGTYYIKDNQPGLGSHVCNCGYMVAEDSRCRGVGEAMGRHSLRRARALGYRAMQFNLVVSTNTPSVRLWHKLGFVTVGRLPGAFAHPELGDVDALVMFRALD